MARFNSPLNHVRIAAPCSADWDQMFAFEGERVRFCSQCQLNVYNLSAMKRSEAEALLISTEGRLCVRFYRRPDGTIITQNCPIGLSAIKRRMTWTTQFILGMVLSLLSWIGLYRLIVSSTLRPVEMGVFVTPMPISGSEVRPFPIVGEIPEPLQGQRKVPDGTKIPRKKAQRLKRR